MLSYVSDEIENMLIKLADYANHSITWKSSMAYSPNHMN